MNKSEINKKANSLFNSIKDVDELIATEDGQFFTVKNKNAAENHCRFINGKTRETPLKHFVIKRNENRGKIVFDEDEYSEEKIIQIIEDDDYQKTITAVTSLDLNESGSRTIPKIEAKELLNKYPNKGK